MPFTPAFTDILTFIETFCTFLFLLLTLELTYGHKHDKITCGISLPCTLLAYFSCYLLCYYFLNQIYHNVSLQYFCYLFLTLSFCLVYGRLFIKTAFTNTLSLVLIYFCCINCTKGLINLLEFLFSNSSQRNFTYSISSQVLLYVFLVCFLWFFKKHPLNISGELPLNYRITFISLPIIFLVITQFYLFSAYTDERTLSYQLLYFVLGDIVLLALYYLSYIIMLTYDNLYATQLVNQRLSLQLDNMNRSTGMIEQIRRDKHEMKNVYFYLDSLAENKEYDKLTEFVHQKLKHRFDTIEEFHTGNQLVDFLLTQKVSEARSLSIQVTTNLSLPEKIEIDDLDLYGVLLNLIDNAIDASMNETHKDIYISISEIKGYLAIKIKNHVSSDVLLYNPHLKTTKSKKSEHGIGLKVVTSIVKKYDGIQNIYVENEYFTTDLMLVNKATKK